MTKSETIAIMSMLGAFYSGGRNDPKQQATAWHMILQKYDFETAKKAVLHFAENDTREYATFPAVGVIVKEIKEQKKRERAPINEIITGIQLGKTHDRLSDDAKRLIGKSTYYEWLDVDAEEFANNTDYYAKLLRAEKSRLMIDVAK